MLESGGVGPTGLQVPRRKTTEVNSAWRRSWHVQDWVLHASLQSGAQGSFHQADGLGRNWLSTRHHGRKAHVWEETDVGTCFIWQAGREANEHSFDDQRLSNAETAGVEATGHVKPPAVSNAGKRGIAAP